MTPVLSYSYCKTIGPTIFNFKQSIKKINFDTDVSNMFCKCTDSPFIDSQIGHILTGNLNIIKDRKLSHTERTIIYTENRIISIGISQNLQKGS